jgi:N-acetylmuramoyl-L-alanine amidase
MKYLWLFMLCFFCSSIIAQQGFYGRTSGKLSIHLNSAGNKNVRGVSTYYRYIGFRPLTQFILNRIMQLKLNNFGNIGAFNFALSGLTEFPNCLVEVAFLSNEEDEKRILDKQFHKDVAKQIYRGIKDWLKSL